MRYYTFPKYVWENYGLSWREFTYKLPPEEKYDIRKDYERIYGGDGYGKTYGRKKGVQVQQRPSRSPDTTGDSK